MMGRKRMSVMGGRGRERDGCDDEERKRDVRERDMREAFVINALLTFGLLVVLKATTDSE